MSIHADTAGGQGGAAMIAFLLLAPASLTAMEDPAPAADMPSGKWATVQIEPSFAETRTEIAIGTLRYDQQAQQLVWRGDLDEKFPSIRMRTDRRGFQVVPALIDAGKRYSQV